MGAGDYAIHFCSWREGILPAPVGGIGYSHIDSKWCFAHRFQHESSVRMGVFTLKNTVQCGDTWPCAKYISFGNVRCKAVSSARSVRLWWDCLWYPCCIRCLCNELPSQVSEFAAILKYLGHPVTLCAWGLIGLSSSRENNLHHYQLFLLCFVLLLIIKNNNILIMNNCYR